ncbi:MULTISPECIES: DUF6440 family protein [Streptococcus]|uniref:DUF6440 domain-containing protein n=1 Tax=Streptococcus downei MFe28 TaxID=764290 RepID=A0A380JE90_STRDO|nr:MULTISPECIES: DUF6440 family protein [Streptococcus]EFQ57311.1 hypothetical protein HMPREF9176_1536 [Streptococcus downei F0415]SUN36342.1 Uncharacterised protein [Streptococcus downei MFe28]
MRTKKDLRFEKRFSESHTGMEIWLDKETGVNYLWHGAGYGGSMTPLLDKDGKPVITPVEDSSNSDLF